MSIEFPKNHKHVHPVFLRGARTNPYAGLEVENGGRDVDERIRAIAGVAAEYQRRVADVAAVFPGRVSDHAPLPYKLFKDTLVPRLKGPEEGAFLMGEAGEDLHMTTRDGIKRGLFQNIGGFGIGITDKLAQQRLAREGAPQRLNRKEFPSLALSPGDLVIETGAGADFERIAALDAYARSSGARLVCHDLLPAAARAVTKEVHVPYVTLPHLADFFGSAFAEVPGAKVVTLNNVLSSMAFGQVSDLGVNLAQMGAKQVSVSQSLGKARGVNLPVDMAPGDPKLELMLINRAIEAGVLRTGANATDICLLSQQFSLTLGQILMEASYNLLSRRMREGGFDYTRRSLLEDHIDLSAEAGAAYLAEHRPALLPHFQSGEINTFETGPFNEMHYRDSRVPTGSLRLVAKKTVVQYAREPFRTDLDGTPVEVYKSLCPPGYRDYGLYYLTQAMSTAGTPISLPNPARASHLRASAKRFAYDFAMGLVQFSPFTAQAIAQIELRLKSDFAQ